MDLILVKAKDLNKDDLIEMLNEWIEDIRINKTNHSPYAIFKNDWNDFDYYLDHLEIKEEKDGKVPDTTRFVYDADRSRIVGAINIRHYLNEKLLYNVGHIGDGIRPSERNKGYGTRTVSLALKECQKMGIDKVLMCCRKDNVASAKTIIRNGGILENEVIEDEYYICQRYWIDLKDKD